MKIGVFDSGVGGITVLQELRARFPSHRYLYFGDTANVPYGGKSPAQIRTLVEAAAHRMKEKELDALVIACNTAASLAQPIFQSILAPIPILDVVEAGVLAVQSAHSDSSHDPILILGTRATIRSKVYSTKLKEVLPHATILEQECPLFVPLIEEGWFEHPALDLTVREYLSPYLTSSPGLALLACTHYPWIEGAIQHHLPGWKILNSAETLTRVAGVRLELRENHSPFPHGIEWYFSDPDSISLAMKNQMQQLESSGPR